MTVYIPTLDEFVQDPWTEESIALGDGESLCARFFEPRGPRRGSVLIAPAMGVPQTWYESFALWLQQQGFLVATFDYRGIGRSRPSALSRVKASVLDWARTDCEAMVRELDRRAPRQPMTWVGHSLGGQILPFVPSRQRINRVVTVGTGSGYWRQNQPALQRVVWLLWYVVAPLTTPVFGYFPGKRFNMVGDLPRNALLQWRRWCLHPDYAVGVEGEWARRAFASVQCPLTVLSFSDDEYMTREGTEALHRFYCEARLQHHRIEPRAHGLKRVGHFGFFRRDVGEALWDRYLRPALAESGDRAGAP